MPPIIFYKDRAIRAHRGGLRTPVLLSRSPAAPPAEESPAAFTSVQTISAPAATGSQTYSVPVNTRALIFMGIGDGATTDGYRPDWGMLFGAATASGAGNQWCISGSEDHGSNPVDNAESSSNAKCIYFAKYNAGTGSVVLSANLTAIDPDLGTFTLNWNATVSGAKVRVMAIGGTGDAGAKAGTFNRRTTTGTLPVAGVGDRPTGSLFGLTRNANDEASAANIRFGIGATGAIGEQWAIWGAHADAAATTNTNARQITTKAGIATAATGGASIYEFSLDSYDTDGFTTNFSTASGSAERVHYLAFYGLSVEVGFITQPTAGGAQNQDSPALGLRPLGVILASYNLAANTTIQNNDRLSFGMSDGANHAGVWAGSLKGSGAATCAAWSDDSAALRLAVETGGGTTNAEIDTITMGADTFTAHWASVDATARQVMYLAFGEAA